MQLNWSQQIKLNWNQSVEGAIYRVGQPKLFLAPPLVKEKSLLTPLPPLQGKENLWGRVGQDKSKCGRVKLPSPTMKYMNKSVISGLNGWCPNETLGRWNGVVLGHQLLFPLFKVLYRVIGWIVPVSNKALE